MVLCNENDGSRKTQHIRNCSLGCTSLALLPCRNLGLPWLLVCPSLCHGSSCLHLFLVLRFTSIVYLVQFPLTEIIFNPTDSPPGPLAPGGLLLGVAVCPTLLASGRDSLLRGAPLGPDALRRDAAQRRVPGRGRKDARSTGRYVGIRLLDPARSPRLVAFVVFESGGKKN
jgi:hypothetical protein